MKLLAEFLSEGNQFPSDYRLLHDELPMPLYEEPINDLRVADLACLRWCSNPRPSIVLDSVYEAARSDGIFQITNHVIRDGVMTNALTPTKMFFDLPTHKLTRECDRCKFYSSSIVHHLNIERGAKFRNAVEPLASALAQLAEQLICLISGGLGLEESYFANKGLSAVRRLNVNKYPRCPKPRLACGLAKHCDPDLLTLTLVEARDGARGLEVCINGEWKRITPHPNAMIVTIGSQMR